MMSKRFKKATLMLISGSLLLFILTPTVWALSLPGGSKPFGGKIKEYRIEGTCPFFTIKVGGPVKVKALVVNLGPLESLFDALEAIPFIGGLLFRTARKAIVPTREFVIKPLLPKEWALGITHSRLVSAGIVLAINVPGALLGINCPNIPVVKLIGSSKTPSLGL